MTWTTIMRANRYDFIRPYLGLESKFFENGKDFVAELNTDTNIVCSLLFWLNPYPNLNISEHLNGIQV